MEEILTNLLNSNEFLQGGLLLGALGIIIAYLRGLPRFLVHLVERWLTVSVAIRDPQLVDWVGQWLAMSDYGERNRWFVGFSHYTDDKLKAVLTPGYGVHRFAYKGTVVWLIHELEDEGVKGRLSVLRIKTLGRSPKVIRGILNESVDLANEEQVGKLLSVLADVI